MKTQLQIKKKRNNKGSNWDSGPSQTQGQREKWYQQEESNQFSFGRGQLVTTRASKDKSSTWGNHATGKEWTTIQMSQQQYQLVDEDQTALDKFIENQVIYLESSPVQQKVEGLKKTRQKFIDDRFPANKRSLYGEFKQDKDWAQIEWVNISKKLPNSSVFIGKIQPQDIKQGLLGDCYFLAGLAALAEQPHRIFNLFLTQQRNDLCYYSVKMLYKGKWMVIDMDQSIPWLYNEPAFSNSVDNQLWVILLEKAWAKLYTSYKRIDGGFNQEALHDLTGAPIKQFFTKNNSKGQIWNYLLEASKHHYSMVCGSNFGQGNTSQAKIFRGHVYTLLNVDILNINGVQHKLVRLRNPHGNGQFNGKWSDKDKNWNGVSLQERTRIGYADKDDGIFFMSFDDLCKEFEDITIAQINDNASYVYKSFKDYKKEGCYFKVQIKKEGTYSLQIDKTPQRSFKIELQNNYQYPKTIVELGCINYRNIQRIKGFSNNNRTTQEKYKFKPGVYIVKVLMNFNPQFEKDYDINLAIYADYPCIISLASNQQASLLEGRRVSWTGQELEEDGPWNHLGAYGYNSKEQTYEEEQQNENEQEQELQRSRSHQYWWRTSAGHHKSEQQQGLKLKSGTISRPQEQNKKSAVMQILKDRQQFLTILQRQDQREQQSSEKNTKVQFGRW